MAKTNVRAPRPTTHEGGIAARITPEQELRRSVMACLLWEDTFYESGQSVAERIDALVDQVPLEVAASVAREARHRMHLRHAPLWVVRAMARRGGSIVGDTLADVIWRADEMGEFVSLYWKDGRRPLSNQVKRGLRAAFHKFDAYQLAKYDRASAVVRPRDVMFLTHPKPEAEEQVEIWRKLADQELEAPDTWEVALSAGEDKAETWTRLLKEQKLGGFALLRNLRNMREANVQLGLIRDAIDAHPFPRVLPFRFIAAAKFVPDFEPSLDRAMVRAAKTLDPLPGKTALVIDVSGSMDGRLSDRSVMSRKDAASGLAIMLREIAEDADVFAFGTTAQYVPARHGMALRDAIAAANVGHATNVNEGLALAAQRGYDRVIVVTDEQIRDGQIQSPLPGASGYVINVASYKNGVGYGAWTHVDGWSEGVVHYVAEYEAADDSN